MKWNIVFTRHAYVILNFSRGYSQYLQGKQASTTTLITHNHANIFELYRITKKLLRVIALVIYLLFYGLGPHFV